jgi:hypothetical protein
MTQEHLGYYTSELSSASWVADLVEPILCGDWTMPIRGSSFEFNFMTSRVAIHDLLPMFYGLQLCDLTCTVCNKTISNACMSHSEFTLVK